MHYLQVSWGSVAITASLSHGTLTVCHAFPQVSQIVLATEWELASWMWYMKRQCAQMQPTWFETNFDYNKPPIPMSLMHQKLTFPRHLSANHHYHWYVNWIMPFHKDANHTTILSLPLVTNYHLSNFPWGGIKWLGQQTQISNWNNANIAIQLLYHDGQVY